MALAFPVSIGQPVAMSEYTPPPMPEQPQSPYQGPRSGELMDRFLARLLDGLIMFVPLMIATVIINVAFAVISNGFFFNYISGVLTGILSVVVFIGYNVYFETNKGATIGKSVMKLKVVGADGVSLPTTAESVKRNIWGASGVGNVIPFIGGFILGLAALVGVIMIAVGISNDTARRQGWHDKFAGDTRVLKVG